MYIVIRVVDKVNPDSVELDTSLLKRGNVVEALPDGWNFSLKEKTNSDWRILRLTNTSEDVISSLLEEEDVDHPNKQRRRKFLNMTDLSRDLPSIVDPLRPVSIIETSLDLSLYILNTPTRIGEV